MNDYIKTLKIPRYHSVSFNENKGYLKLSYQDLYVVGDIVLNNFDKMRVIRTNKLEINEIKKIINDFITNGLERNKTRPYRIRLLEDIDSVGEENFWNLNY